MQLCFSGSSQLIKSEMITDLSLPDDSECFGSFDARSQPIFRVETCIRSHMIVRALVEGRGTQIEDAHTLASSLYCRTITPQLLSFVLVLGLDPAVFGAGIIRQESSSRCTVPSAANRNRQTAVVIAQLERRPPDPPSFTPRLPTSITSLPITVPALWSPLHAADEPRARRDELEWQWPGAVHISSHK